MKKITSLSIVIPVYNDVDVLSELFKRLIPVVEKLTDDSEIIMIDDGSKDNSWNELVKFQRIHKNIVAVKLAKNFGQANAITAGLELAQKEYIVIMDSDLQDPPEFIENLYDSCVEQDAEMAIAKRITRKDSFIKVTLSKIFNQFVQKATTIYVPEGLGVFRILKKSAFEKISNTPEITGTTLSLMYWAGIDYVTVDVNREARFAGTSGYTLNKMLSLASARIFSYSLWPLRIATSLGTTIVLLSTMLALYYIYRYFSHGISVDGWTTLIVLVLFLFSTLFVILGIIGEYIGRIYIETKKRPKYVIRKIEKQD